MARHGRTSRRRGKVMKVIYTILAVFVLGYFPPCWLLRSGGPQISMVALGLLTMAYASRTGSILKGLLIGVGIGLGGGLSTSFAMIHQGTVTNRLVAASILGTTFLCAAIGALFAYMGKKRAERAERQWH